MFAFTNSTDRQSPTIIGAGCKLNGDINTDHAVQIHGDLLGKVQADVVVIGKGGSVNGRVVANVVFLHGNMDGPIECDVANIFSNATMSGNLYYSRLNITSNDRLECKLIHKDANKAGSKKGN
ncbi:MAG: polymer-forming cytoskeletal protein [Rickettsiales bacterium]|nr:polymer-forming cytoskeletal protein [Rickettsiales bacterium]